jgi:gliding motility-associated-like protein
VLDTTSTVAPSCGQADGTINVQAVGGDGNYTYSIDNGPFAASNSFTNLGSGTYEIVVQDGSGACSDTIDVQLSDLNAPVIAAVNVTDPLCNGELTGEIEVIANGGFGALDYEIANPAPLANSGTGVFTGLAAGNYTVTVTDANGCQAADDAIIVEPLAVTVDFNSTDVSCFGLSDGEIEVIGGGGTAGYNYSIDNGVTWSANPIFSGLTAQTYQVVVEDANGCLSPVEDVTVGESNALVVNTVVTDVSCFNSCDGSITWNVVGGTAPYNYVSNGVNLGFNTAVDLCAGNYNYTITDANGCSSIGAEVVQPGVEIVPVIIARIDDGCTDDCDGEIVIGSNTGVSYTLNGVSSPTGIFTGLCAGSYNIVVTDANGCTADQDVMIGTIAPTYADFLSFPTTLTVYNNTVNFNNSSTNADQYEWNIVGQNGYSHTYTTEDVEHTFPADTGTYQVCLTAINTGGCQDEMCVTIIVEDEIALYVPNSFTPDDDEFNQTFRAYVNGIDLFDFDFLIFNRWGELIWESHDAAIGWDGTYKGKLVQEGTYVWKIVVKDLQLDYRRTYTGHVSILR